MIFDPILDIFRGKAVTIPPYDGAFRPNTLLDEAPVICQLSEPDNLVVWKGRLTVSSGTGVFALNEAGEAELVETFPAPVTALAVSPEGQLAVALETGGLLVGGEAMPLPDEIMCITALAYGPHGTLWLANGSIHHTPSGWAADLMEKNATGSIWRHETIEGSFRKVASGLAWPYGLLPDVAGVVVAESWRHRLVRFEGSGARSRVVEHLPGYPARLTPMADGGALLSMFAPRNRLIELVLQEKHYRYDMMLQIPREYWIAPSLASGRSFLEPLQCGGIKRMGVHKPWSPSRSYGLVVRLDADMQPVESFHSRANGVRHGVCSAAEYDGRIYAAAKGGDCVLTLEAAGE